MSADIDERRKAAYAKLGEVVQELSDIDDADPNVEFSQPNIPSGWVLVVGSDVFDEAMNPDGGVTGVYPRDGMQASWKTIGLLSTALGRMNQ